MENIQLSLYKRLLNFERISTLEFMRKNPEFFDIPGYEISKMLKEGVKEGYIEQFEDTHKAYYSATNKCREYFEKIEKDKKEKAEFEAKQRQLKTRKQKTIVVSVASVISIIFIAAIVFNTIIIPNRKYENAISLMYNGEYEDAINIFNELVNHKDSKNKINECNTAILEIEYNKAISLMDSGDYSSAVIAFRSLNYKDSVEKTSECLFKKQMSDLKNINVGDYIKFGEYEQDNNLENGKEEIEWLVLDKKGDKIWLISKYALDEQPYNNSSTNVTWETCSLRQWLNNEFSATAFSKYHLEKIQTSHVTADINPAIIRNPDTPLSHKGITPGNSTEDKIFLLSGKEAENLLPAENMQTFMTEYADPEREEYYSNYCYWWLRTPGWHNQNFAMYFANNANCSGKIVCPQNLGVYVRPAMWISIE